MIEDYKFGCMIIDGNTYNSDLILFPDKIQSSWWRESGHRLYIKDLEEVFKEEPYVLVIGTGSLGFMKIDKEVEKFAISKRIKLIIEKTKKAVQVYNIYSIKSKTIGAFHLTC